MRRLHDVGKSGWWMLIGFVPIIGTIVLLIFRVRDSQPKREIPNQDITDAVRLNGKKQLNRK